VYSHLTIGCNDLDRAMRFYDALFTAAGGTPGMRLDEERALYAHKDGMLIVTRPVDGQPATFGNGITVGLTMDSPEQVEAWHAAGAAAGGTPCEDPPGLRDKGVLKMHLAYLRDPDGNKLCAVYRYPE
jgi:catechol 2,3-dioxygenase-like lactoylglutathione lyase family enzyme